MKLRELKEKDASAMLEWMKLPESREIFVKDFNHFSLEDVKDFISHSNDDQNINLACVDDSDNYLGTISLKNIDKKNNNAEYAVSFSKSAQGTGAAMFATQEILKIAFNELKLKKVYLNVLATNQRAIAFYKKVGFQEEGIAKSQIFKNGKYLNLIWFAILDEQWSTNE